MPKRIEYPRLTRRDCERLLDVHQQLNRVKDSLEHGNWTGGRMAAGCLLSALILVSDLYNRAEQAFLRPGQTNTEPSPEEEISEATAAPVEAGPRLELVVDKPEV